MNEMVFDTNILIDHLKGVEKATALVNDVQIGKTIGYISVLTEAEIFSGKEVENAQKKVLVTELIDIFNKVDVNEELAKIAGEFRRKYGVAIPDCIIAATAFIKRCGIFTQDIDDFKKIKDIEAEKPY